MVCVVQRCIYIYIIFIHIYTSHISAKFIVKLKWIKKHLHIPRKKQNKKTHRFSRSFEGGYVGSQASKSNPWICTSSRDFMISLYRCSDSVMVWLVSFNSKSQHQIHKSKEKLEGFCWPILAAYDSHIQDGSIQRREDTRYRWSIIFKFHSFNFAACAHLEKQTFNFFPKFAWKKSYS